MPETPSQRIYRQNRELIIADRRATRREQAERDLLEASAREEAVADDAWDRLMDAVQEPVWGGDDDE